MISKSWELPRDGEMHSPAGVRELRITLKDALIRKYAGIAESMFRWNLHDEFSDMTVMSRDTEPEKTLLRSGQGAFFRLYDQIHFLPVVYDGTINIYGNPTTYRVMPVGWESTPTGINPDVDHIREMVFSADDSVLLRDNLFGISDYSLIEKACGALVDTMLTLNQLTLLAKSPFIFRVTDDNKLDAKNFFLALSQDCPAIFRHSGMDELENVTEQTGSTIDTGLFDVYRHWENILLEQLGIPGSQPTQKRAQQTEAEITLGDDMVSIRRKEKFRMREAACERMRELWGVEVSVESLIDTQQDDREMESEDGGDDDDE